MIEHRYQVEYDDGREFEVSVGIREHMALELKFDIGIKQYAMEPRMTWTSFVCYEAAKRLHSGGEHPGPIKSTWHDFCEQLGGITPLDDNDDGDEDPDPLEEPGGGA